MALVPAVTFTNVTVAPALKLVPVNVIVCAKVEPVSEAGLTLLKTGPVRVAVTVADAAARFHPTFVHKYPTPVSGGVGHPVFPAVRVFV